MLPYPLGAVTAEGTFPRSSFNLGLEGFAIVVEQWPDNVFLPSKGVFGGVVLRDFM